MAKARKGGGGSRAGNDIMEALRAILDRCREAGARLAYPGEGGERSFRHWLATDLLESTFGWPNEKVVIGERFDVLLQDELDRPVVTIETKAPDHEPSDSERRDFEGGSRPTERCGRLT